MHKQTTIKTPKPIHDLIFLPLPSGAFFIIGEKKRVDPVPVIPPVYELGEFTGKFDREDN